MVGTNDRLMHVFIFIVTISIGWISQTNQFQYLTDFFTERWHKWRRIWILLGQYTNADSCETPPFQHSKFFPAASDDVWSQKPAEIPPSKNRRHDRCNKSQPLQLHPMHRVHQQHQKPFHPHSRNNTRPTNAMAPGSCRDYAWSYSAPF